MKISLERLKSDIRDGLVLSLTDCECFSVRGELFVSLNDIRERLVEWIENRHKGDEELEKLPKEAQRAVMFVNFLNTIPLKKWDKFIEV